MKLFLLIAVIFYSFYSFGVIRDDGMDLGKSIRTLQAEVQGLKEKHKKPMFAKTAYVNILSALESTKQGQKVKNRLEKSAKKAKKQFKATELTLQKEEETLKKDAPLLSDQAKAKRIQQLQQKIFNFQREAKSKDLELQNLQSQLMSPVIERLKGVIGETAKKEGYLVVENIGNDVLWVDPELDLTKKATVKFNKKYK